MKKKILACIVVVVLALSIIGCAACSNESSFDKVVDCASYLQSVFAKSTDLVSFEIDDDCGYRRGYEEYIFSVFIYIPFYATYADDDYWHDVAFFVGGDFVGFYTDYMDETYEEWDDELQLEFLTAVLMFVKEDASETFSKEDVMKAIAPADEAVSGEQVQE